MNKTLMAAALLAACVSFGAQAQSTDTSDAGTTTSNNGGWTGSGEFGFASATGNTRSQNANAKLNLGFENEHWKNSAFLDGLRTKAQHKTVEPDGTTVSSYDETANRYDAGASVGYKLDPRSYIVGAGRYEHDDFGANLWQGVVSLGYGYIALKDARTELSFEVGPGYKKYRPADLTVLTGNVSTKVRQPTEHEAIARGLMNFKYRLTANTAFDNTFLVESGSKNTYLQNDAGLAVSMTRKLALKIGFEVRHNSNVVPGLKRTDTLTTTNLVYNL